MVLNFRLKYDGLEAINARCSDVYYGFGFLIYARYFYIECGFFNILDKFYSG